MRSVRSLAIGASFIFLLTIVLGFANAFMDDISRGQILAHFHAGTIGWITLTVMASAFHMFGPGSDAWTRTADILSPITIVAAIGYVASFGFVFSDLAPAWLLPLFGIPTGLAIITAFVLVAVRWRDGTPGAAQMLMTGALLVASIGAIMGILVGLALNGAFTFPAAANAVGAHAGPMDMYLALAVAGILEVVVGFHGRAWPAWTQVGLGVVSGLVAAVALFVGIEALMPVSLLLFVAGFVVYMVRIGWRTFRHSPWGPTAATFWTGLFFPLYIGLFVFMVPVYHIPGNPIPAALAVSFAHITFVGVASNAVLAIQPTLLGRPARNSYVPGILVTNIGLLAFLLGEWLAGMPHGAIIMGVGLLMAIGNPLRK